MSMIKGMSARSPVSQSIITHTKNPSSKGPLQFLKQLMGNFKKTTENTKAPRHRHRGALKTHSEKVLSHDIQQKKSDSGQSTNNHQRKSQLSAEGIFIDPRDRREALSQFVLYKDNKIKDLKSRLIESKNEKNTAVAKHKRAVIAREVKALKHEIKLFNMKYDVSVALGKLS